MADTTVNRYVRWMGEEVFYEWVVDNSVAAEIYIGSPMWIDVSGDTVYPTAYLASHTPATGDRFVGFALERMTVATTDTETDNVLKISEPGSVFGLPANSLTDADVGEDIYMADSGSVTTTSTGAIIVGVLRKVKDSYAFIHFEKQYITA